MAKSKLYRVPPSWYLSEEGAVSCSSEISSVQSGIICQTLSYSFSLWFLFHALPYFWLIKNLRFAHYVKFKVSLFPGKSVYRAGRGLQQLSNLVPLPRPRSLQSDMNKSMSSPHTRTQTHTHTHTQVHHAMQNRGDVMRITMCIMVIMSVNGLIIWDCANDNNDAPEIVISQNRAGGGCH